jgi:plastocyanin
VTCRVDPVAARDADSALEVPIVLRRLAFGLATPLLVAAGAVLPAAAQPDAAPEAAGPTLMIATRDYAYDPSYPTVPVGTTVTWTNFDRELHTVTSDDGVLDGEIQPRQRYTITFDQPGVYFYYCLTHDWMIGEVTVGDPES